MIGDAFAKGKRKIGSSEFKEKNSRGRSFKTVDSTPEHDSGGDSEDHAVAKRSTKGMRPGIGARSSTVEPYRQRNSAGQSFKTVGPRAIGGDSGAAINAWCCGKTKGYKA